MRHDLRREPQLRRIVCDGSKMRHNYSCDEVASTMFAAMLDVAARRFEAKCQSCVGILYVWRKWPNVIVMAEARVVTS